MNSYNWTDYKEIKVMDENRKTLLVKNINTDVYYIKKYVLPEQIPVYQRLIKVQNENLAKVYGVSESSDLYGPDYAMVLEEYIEGKTMEHVLEEKGIFSTKITLNKIFQLCNGLKCVHLHGIVHRDIKPSNIVIAKTGTVKIIDFGIARIIKADKNKDTTFLGTEGYASPEQFGFSQTKATADIYSLGVLMNVMLTGHSPDEEMCKEPLRKVVIKCTDLNPKYRYESIEKLKVDLQRIQRIHYASPFHKGLRIALMVLVVCTVILGSFNLYKMQEDKKMLQEANAKAEEKEEIQEEDKVIESPTDDTGLTTQDKNSSLAVLDSSVNKNQLAAQDKEVVIPDSPDLLYVVNQSLEEVNGKYFTNGNGSLVFDSFEPLDEAHDLGFSGVSYISYCVPESSINFWLVNNGDTTIRNPVVQFEFTNIMLWGETQIEDWTYYNHVQGLGGYGSIKWEPGEDFVLRPGEKSEMNTLYLSESPVFTENGDASVTINVLSDDCKSKSFTVPITLDSHE